MGVAIIAHGQVAVVVHHLGAVVLRQQVQVFLGVDVDLFFPGFVFKAQFVAALALVGFGLEGGAGFVFRQRIRRRVSRVPSRKDTITSWPILGSAMKPY
jgi:hypothetical protein